MHRASKIRSVGVWAVGCPLDLTKQSEFCVVSTEFDYDVIMQTRTTMRFRLHNSNMRC